MGTEVSQNCSLMHFEDNSTQPLRCLPGFEISLGPHYIATSGLAWLERGGVYVEANIRGGE